MEKNLKQSKMAVMPMGKLMLSMGIPMILSMAMQALYNIVDSAFVARIPENGEAALNALTLAFPVQMLMVAIGIGTGVGANALLSRSLGQGNRDKADRVCGNAVFLGIIICIGYILFGLMGVKPYIATQTSNALITDMAVEYLEINCLVSFGIVFFAIFEKLLQSTGRSLYSTIAQISGAVVNIILDPVLIYGWFGLPATGVIGAAWATVIGQIVSFALALTFHLTKNVEIKNSIKNLKPSTKIIREIYTIGFPAIIAQALMSFMTYALNVIFVRIDETVVTAYGLYYKIQQFILFLAFGLRDAITPIVSFNYGMGSRSRVKAGIKYGMGYTLAIMLVGCAVLEIFAVQFTAVFGLSDTTAELCISAMRIISLSFVFAGANVAYQGIFQALGRGLESLVISVLRQFLFVLPAAWAFSLLAIKDFSNVWTVWLTFPIAEVLSAVIATILMSNIYKKKIRPLGEVTE